MLCSLGRGSVMSSAPEVFDARSSRFAGALRRPSGGQPDPLMTACRTMCCASFFVTQGVCKNPTCTFVHDKTAKDQYVATVKRRRAEASQHPDDPHGALDKVSHRQRAAVFAQWLIATFGLPTLQQGGVLDVAGGRGELSFELALAHDIPVTVVDPRTVKLNKPQFKRLKQEKGLSGDLAKQWFAKHIKHIKTTMDPAFFEVPSQSQVVARTAVLVGLHPDEATGAICESAVKHGKPFAVVPCCVFSDMFPERTIENRQVRTHDDICAWIKTLAPGVGSAFLGFAGKNRVVFLTKEINL
mmetsp:Transcript_71783/g.191443  ORF Transcript_71783/g.191443 Transcript_71783/m.191443 type:complete len:299 (+) Transcript_71783:638-1534(+)